MSIVIVCNQHVIPDNALDTLFSTRFDIHSEMKSPFFAQALFALQFSSAIELNGNQIDYGIFARKGAILV